MGLLGSLKVFKGFGFRALGFWVLESLLFAGRGV